MADTGRAPKSAPADNVREIFVNTCGAIGATILERANDRSDQSYRGRGSRSYAATKVYLDTLGASVSEMVAQPDHGVTTIFVNLANAKIELIAPLGNASPIEKFLESNPEGGIHHVCYEVNDIVAAREQLKAGGARMLGDEPKIGAHGKPVLFLHPEDFCGTLVELSRRERPSRPAGRQQEN